MHNIIRVAACGRSVGERSYCAWLCERVFSVCVFSAMRFPKRASAVGNKIFWGIME